VTGHPHSPLPAPRFARFALVLSLVLALNPGCTADRSTPVSVEDLSGEEQPDQQSWNVEYYLGEAGTGRAILRAPHLSRYEQGDSVLVVLDGTAEEPVRVEVYGVDGERSDVSAMEIRFYEDRRIYHLSGQVVLTASTGRTLEGDQLVWDEPGHRLRSDGFVSIVSEERTLQGYGLDADEVLDNFTLHRVTGRFYVEDE
jgi:LPS export ABC transporter protein LptC